MNGALKWKLVAGFVLVFVAGGIAGAALGGLYARHLFFDVHYPRRVGDRMKERLRAELSLTPEQVAKVSPIVDKTAAQLQEIRRDTGRRVHAIMTEAHKEIAVNLTDEQRQKLQQIEERHRRWRHRRGPREFAPESSPTTPSRTMEDGASRRLSHFPCNTQARRARSSIQLRSERPRAALRSQREFARARRRRRGL